MEQVQPDPLRSRQPSSQDCARWAGLGGPLLQLSPFAVKTCEGKRPYTLSQLHLDLSDRTPKSIDHRTSTSHTSASEAPSGASPGYKFNIFYPDLIDKTKAPTYHVEKSDTADTAPRTWTGGNGRRWDGIWGKGGRKGRSLQYIEMTNYSSL